MNVAQRIHLDELLEKEFPAHRFIEKETPQTFLIECTCGWKFRSRKSSRDVRRAVVKIKRQQHLLEKH